ncbi:MAG: cyclic pyranopterin monophosphate synthase MoaC [Candidatus Baltobacteraceae bacterium]
MQKPSHIGADGSISMVDVSAKVPTLRTARALARVRMSAEARECLQAATLPKGDALVAAQLAGILAAKQTAMLIPLCHPLSLDAMDVTFGWEEDGALLVTATARTTGPTGVEMEAMVAASVAALTIYDMTKALDKSITIEQVCLMEKTGGKSGTWRRN